MSGYYNSIVGFLANSFIQYLTAKKIFEEKVALLEKAPAVAK